MANKNLTLSVNTSPSWNSASNVCDGNSSTSATLSVKSSNASSRYLALNVESVSDFSKATLKFTANGSSSTSTRLITLTFRANSTTGTILGTQQLSRTSTEYTIDITNSLSGVTTLYIIPSIGSDSSTTLTLSELSISVETGGGGTTTEPDNPPSSGDSNKPDSILPAFNSGSWSGEVTNVTSNGYDISCTASKAWIGYGCSPTNIQAGDKITVEVLNTSSNVSIEMWGTSSEWLSFPQGTGARHVTVTITDISDLWFSLSATGAGIITVEGLRMYKGDYVDGGGEVEQPEEPVNPPSDDDGSILPPFNSSSWSGDVTNVISDGNNISYTANQAWVGYGCTLENIQVGDKITVEVSSTSSNVSIELWDSSSNELLSFPSGTGARYSTIIITDSIPWFSISATGAGTVTVEGLKIYKGDYVGGSGGGEEEPPVGELTEGTDPYPLLGKQVGYREVAQETQLATNNVVVTNTTQFTNAVNNATAGQTIYVKNGTYNLGTLNISKAGTSSAYITIKNYPHHKPTITGTTINFTATAKYVNFEGFLIKDLTGSWIACVTVQGGASYINIRNNEITNISQQTTNDVDGCNPLVLYGDSTTPITNCIVENNYIHDCDTGWSEALTLNGNVTNCQVLQNTIDNCKNIGIDLAGNFSWTGTVGDSNNQTRFITVARNLVMNCQSPYATSAGLYCDGGRDNTFEYNVCYNCQCGIECGAEEPGATVENFYLRNNLLIDCGRAIGIGGYKDTSATHRNAYIYNNTIICTNGQKENHGLLLERTSNIEFYNNIVIGQSGTVFFESTRGATNVKRGNNVYYKSGGSLPSGETNSVFGDPKLTNLTYDLTGNYSLTSNSTNAINKGTNSTEANRGAVDLLKNVRLNGTIDIGAYEYTGTIAEPEPTGIDEVFLGHVQVPDIYYGTRRIIEVRYRNQIIYQYNGTVPPSSGGDDNTGGNTPPSTETFTETDIYNPPSITSNAKHVGNGQTYSTIQSAITALGSNGGQVVIHGGTYNEKITFNNSGTTSNPIVIMNAPNEKPIITGGTVGNAEVCVFDLNGKSNIVINGLEIANTTSGTGSSAVAIGVIGRGGESNIIIANNTIHDIKTTGVGDGKGEANAILLYGETTTPISNVLVYNNHVYNMVTNWSESISVAGNCENVRLINNTVHDVTNIAMDFYGNAGYCSTASLDQPRNCVMRGNVVYNLNCSYDGAAAYYCDGAINCIIERNIAHNCSGGIEIGAEENRNNVVGHIIVRNNLIYDSEGYEAVTFKIGGYQDKSPSVIDVKIYNNTFITTKSDVCLFAWGKSDNIVIKNNIFFVGSSADGFTAYEDYQPTNVTWANNLYYFKGSASSSFSFEFNGSGRNWSTWTASYDKTGIYTTTNPFNSDYTLANNSPAIDKGVALTVSEVGEYDLKGEARVKGNAIDIGAYEK